MKIQKLKRTFITGVTILATCLLGFTSSVSAKTVSTGQELELGLEQYRNSGFSYKTGDKIMWKIASYEGQIPDKTRNFYCIKAGPGFGSTDMGAGSFTPTHQTYTEYFDLKSPDSIEEPYKSVLPTGEEYNSLVWLLDNIYLAPQIKQGEQMTEEQKQERQAFLDAAGIGSSEITDDEIDVVQQLAIWYFTNDDEYKLTNKTFTLSIKQVADSDYDTLGNKYGFDGQQRNTDAIQLFNYLINKAEENKSTLPTADVNPITFTTAGAKTELVGDKYIIGPYKIDKTTNKEFTLALLLKETADAGSKEITYQLLDSQKQVTSQSLEELVGTEFYLQVPATENIENAQVQLKTKVRQKNITFWSVKGANPQINQPVVEVTDDDQEYVDNVNVPKNYVFDLALRKFITKINDVEVEVSREPQISTDTIQNLQNGSVTTVTKTHTKEPLLVNKGDTVLYTIRIYNEGELDGYAKEVTDYLPAGLILKENSDINDANGWENPSGDGKTIVTTKLANQLIGKFNGTEVKYVDLQVECEVVGTSTATDQHFKNVAEITKHSDAEGNENIVDRDSTPDNLTEEQKNNYNPGTSEQGWGYEDDDDYEELILPGKNFDLALRKFITNINGKELVDEDGNYIREPVIDVTPLKDGSGTTAIYKHRKDPVGVAVGDIVIYTIRVYNEGELDGYASSITDYLPPQLEFVTDDEENFNAAQGWILDQSLRKVTTTILSRTQIDPEENLIKAFDPDTMSEPDYKEVKIKCRVKSVSDLDEVITNIAEITDFTDEEGNPIVDRDSQEDNIILPTDENLPDYKGNTSNKSVLDDEDYFYKGQQDDDDFEKLILQEFDLALRKFITGVNDEEVTNRVPVFTNVKDENGNYIYEHTKEPILVETTDVVEYTIRIYNEGDIAGYAKEVKDDIPDGLEFLPDHATNQEYRWVMLDENGNETQNVGQAKYIVTDYLSRDQALQTGRDNLLDAFDPDTMQSPDYRDVKVAFKVIAPNEYSGIITNIAEIAEDEDENGEEVDDKDSTPDNGDETEDDIDKEHVKLQYFDLALRKFITAVDETEVTDRYPVFSIDENGNYIYTHTKEPVEVENGNIVTYTLRIYNEGTQAGYAKEVKDDIPDGLEFLPDHELNQEYRWVMLDENGEVTEDVSKAVDIQTDYLSKEQGELAQRDNLLQAFDPETMEEPDYRDLKIAFKVTEPNTSDRIIINYAQISDDEDEEGNDVVDKDSTPDSWIEGEDDQDIEKIKVKYFDLALRKWVTQAIVIENGKETITETGHKPEDDPEAPVKVEIVASKINKVVVKFRYSIRVTNEGEIAGYVKEIKDYIPEGLKFVQADNPNWKQESENIIVTDQLKDTLLQPGESADVEVLLTWINDKNNMGLKVNVAEISEDDNESDTPDIDSTPDNKKDGEDDIDDAPVVLSTKTGGQKPTVIVGLTLGALVLVVGGVVLIKKFII